MLAPLIYSANVIDPSRKTAPPHITVKLLHLRARAVFEIENRPVATIANAIAVFGFISGKPGRIVFSSEISNAHPPSAIADTAAEKQAQ